MHPVPFQYLALGDSDTIGEKGILRAVLAGPVGQPLASLCFDVCPVGVFHLPIGQPDYTHSAKALG